MNTEKIAKIVRPIIADKLYLHDKTVTMDADLCKDLGADSLDIVEITIALENEFDIDIYDEEIDTLATVENVVELVADKLKCG